MSPRRTAFAVTLLLLACVEAAQAVGPTPVPAAAAPAEDSSSSSSSPGAGEGGEDDLAPALEDALDPTSNFPNFLSVPELDIYSMAFGSSLLKSSSSSSTDAAAPHGRLLARARDRRRRLQEVPADPKCDPTTTSCPTILLYEHQYGNFTGVRNGAFLDLSFNAVVLNTTLFLDDYADVLLADGARMECSDGSAAHMDKNGALVRNAVGFLVSLSPDADAVHGDVLDLLASRLDRIGDDSTSIVIGAHLALLAPAFRRGGSCANIGMTSPYFTAVAHSLERTDSAATLRLFLLPADVSTVFGGLDAHFVWDPVASREVNRRRELGLYLPHDVDTQLARHLADYTYTFADFSVNYDKATGASKTNKLNIIPGNILYCEDCYAYLNVRVDVTLKMCLKFTSPVNQYHTYQYDTTDFRGQAENEYSWDFSTSTPKNGAPLPDCRSLGGPADPTFVDVAFRVEAKLIGETGFKVLIKSDGVDVQTSTCSRQTDTDISKASCRTTLVNDIVLPRISFSVGTVPVYVTPRIGLQAAGYANAEMAGRLQMGAKASTTATIGAYLQYQGTNPEAGFYNSMTGSWTTYPFILEGFKDASGSVAGHLIPKVTLTLFDTVPIVGHIVLKAKYDVSLNKRRALRHGDEAAASGRRELPDCELGSYASDYSGDVTVGLQKTTLTDIGLVKSFMTDYSIPAWTIPSVTIVENSESDPANFRPSTTLSSGCIVRATPQPTVVSGSLTFSGLSYALAAAAGDTFRTVVRLSVAAVSRVNASAVNITSLTSSARRLESSAGRLLQASGGVVVAFEVQSPSLEAAAIISSRITTSLRSASTSAGQSLIASVAMATGVPAANLGVASAANVVLGTSGTSGDTAEGAADLPVAAIAGGSAGGVLLLILIAVGGYFVRGRQPVKAAAGGATASAAAAAGGGGPALQAPTASAEETFVNPINAARRAAKEPVPVSPEADPAAGVAPPVPAAPPAASMGAPPSAPPSIPVSAPPAASADVDAAAVTAAEAAAPDPTAPPAAATEGVATSAGAPADATSTRTSFEPGTV
jgi:hypothetical protein